MKPQTAAHTPTPWKFENRDEDNYLAGPEGQFVISLVGSPDDEDKENAAFIVRAVNAHEELLKRLKECYEKLEFKGYSNASVEKAIAKAEGK